MLSWLQRFNNNINGIALSLSSVDKKKYHY